MQMMFAFKKTDLEKHREELTENGIQFVETKNDFVTVLTFEVQWPSRLIRERFEYDRNGNYIKTPLFKN